MLIRANTLFRALLALGAVCCTGRVHALVQPPSMLCACGGSSCPPPVSRASSPPEGPVLQQSKGRARRGERSILSVRCSGGIIIAAGDGDLGKELSRIQTVPVEADLAWRSGALHREWDLPLQGERVMFTTPRQFAGKLSSVLVDAGARPVWMPTVRYVPLPESNAIATNLDVALLEIQEFDIVSFTSRYAMQGFWERMQILYGDMGAALRVLDDARIKFATTPSLQSRLKETLVSMSDRILACDHGASDLSDVLATTASGASVLCVTPAFEELEDPKPLSLLLNRLSSRGLDVTRAPSYLVRAGDADLYKPELEGLMRGDIDVLGTNFSLLSECDNDRECVGHWLLSDG
jgi:uroporphyrinogen-III synthase